MQHIKEYFFRKVKIKKNLNIELKIYLRSFKKDFLDKIPKLEKFIFARKYYNSTVLKFLTVANNPP